jgi:uncharacterized membrane protein
MSELLVIVFDTEAEGAEALESLRGLERTAGLRLDDAAVVTKDPDGKVHVKNQVSSGTAAGGAVGGLLGLLLFFIFPVAGVVAGAAAGAVIGHLAGQHVDKTFVSDVSRSLEPGKSALLILVRRGSPASIVGAMKPFKGKVLQTTLSSELEEQLQEALE